MRLSVGIALLAAVAGCGLFGGRGERTPAPIRIRLDAAPRLNPDETGESLPTSVRVYQLASAGKAGRAELLELVRDPKEALGPDLLGVAELLVQPGGRAEETVAREKGTRAVLVAALFRRPGGTSWREIVELPGPGHSVELSFALDEYRIARR